MVLSTSNLVLGAMGGWSRWARPVATVLLVAVVGALTANLWLAHTATEIAAEGRLAAQGWDRHLSLVERMRVAAEAASDLMAEVEHEVEQFRQRVESPIR